MKYYKLFSNAIIDFYFAGNYVYTMPYAYAKGTISMFAYVDLEPKVLISNLGMMSHDTLVAAIKFYRKASGNTGYILMRVDTSKISNSASWGVFESKYVTPSNSMVETTEEQAIAEGFTQEFAPIIDHHDSIEDKYNTDRRNYKISFYHNNDTRYLVLNIGFLYNQTSMMHIDLNFNSYNNNSTGSIFNLSLSFYLYNSYIYGGQLLITTGNNAYNLHNGFFISRIKNTNEVVVVFDKNIIQDSRVYLSGVWNIFSSKKYDVGDFKRLSYFQINTESDLNSTLDLTWKFDLNNIRYVTTSYTMIPYQYSNVSFADIVNNNTTQALDALDPSTLQDMQFLQVANYSGIFMKHGSNYNYWSWIVFDAYNRDKIIQRYSYNKDSANAKYSICTFNV